MKKNDINFFLRRWSLVLLSAALVVVSAHVDGLHWLAMLWILPLAVALKGVTPRQAVLMCFTCAFIFWVLSINWLLEPLLDGAGATTFLAVSIFLCLCAWQAIPYAVLGYCYARFHWSKHLAGPFMAAAVLTVAWSYWPTLIPGLPEHSLYHYPQLIAILDLSGTSGLLFLSTLFGFSLQRLIVFNTQKQAWAVIALLIPVVMFSYGALRDAQYQAELKTAGQNQWFKVAYIQPSIDRPAPADMFYILSEEAILQESPDLLVWPEPAIVYSFIDRQEDRKKTMAIMEKYDQDMLINSGYVYATDDTVGEMRTYYNRVHLLRDGEIVGEYSKQILVPFYEYMPKGLAFLRRWLTEVNYFRAGKNQQPIRYNDNIKIGAMVCYEAIFPSYVEKLIDKGANILINPVSDTRFGETSGPYYHLALAYFRSIENRVPFVRVANTGMSMVVAANGKVISGPTGLYEVTSGGANIFVPEKRSIYSRVGDWLALALLVILMVCAMFFYNKKIKKQLNQ